MLRSGTHPRRRRRGLRSLLAFAFGLAAVPTAHARNKLDAERLGGASVDVPLFRAEGGRNVVSARIGTPQQVLNLTATTSEWYLAPVGAGCSECLEAGDGPKPFNQSASSTYAASNDHLVYSFNYPATPDDTLDLFGPFARDTVALQSQTPADSPLVVLDAVRNGMIRRAVANGTTGFWGLGVDPVQRARSAVVAAAQRAGGTFTFGVDADAFGLRPPEAAGTVHWGGVPESAYVGDFNWLLANATTGWSTAIDNINFNGQLIDLRGYVATFDPGFDEIYVPQEVAARAFRATPAARVNNQDPTRWLFLCNTNLTMSVTLGGVEYAVDPATLVSARWTQGICSSNFVSWQNSTMYASRPGRDKEIRLGTAFLSGLYTAFYYSETEQYVGLAGKTDSANPHNLYSPPPRKSNKAVIGGVLGTLIPLLAIGLAIFVFVRRRRRLRNRWGRNERDAQWHEDTRALQGYNDQPLEKSFSSTLVDQTPGATARLTPATPLMASGAGLHGTAGTPSRFVSPSHLQAYQDIYHADPADDPHLHEFKALPRRQRRSKRTRSQVAYTPLSLGAPAPLAVAGRHLPGPPDAAPGPAPISGLPPPISAPTTPFTPGNWRQLPLLGLVFGSTRQPPVPLPALSMPPTPPLKTANLAGRGAAFAAPSEAADPGRRGRYDHPLYAPGPVIGASACGHAQPCADPACSSSPYAPCSRCDVPHAGYECPQYVPRGSASGHGHTQVTSGGFPRTVSASNHPFLQSQLPSQTQAPVQVQLPPNPSSQQQHVRYAPAPQAAEAVRPPPLAPLQPQYTAASYAPPQFDEHPAPRARAVSGPAVAAAPFAPATSNARPQFSLLPDPPEPIGPWRDPVPRPRARDFAREEAEAAAAAAAAAEAERQRQLQQERGHQHIAAVTAAATAELAAARAAEDADAGLGERGYMALREQALERERAYQREKQRERVEAARAAALAREREDQAAREAEATRAAAAAKREAERERRREERRRERDERERRARLERREKREREREQRAQEREREKERGRERGERRHRDKETVRRKEERRRERS